MYLEDFSRRGSWFKVIVSAVIMSQNVSIPGVIFSTNVGLRKRQEGTLRSKQRGKFKDKTFEGPLIWCKVDFSALIMYNK